MKKENLRHNIQSSENIVLFDDHGGKDSSTAFVFPNNNNHHLHSSNKNPSTKKIKKNDSQKMEELQTGYDALKSHLKIAFDDIEKLKKENNELRKQKEINYSRQNLDFKSLSMTHEEKDEDKLENKLEDTL